MHVENDFMLNLYICITESFLCIYFIRVYTHKRKEKMKNLSYNKSGDFTIRQKGTDEMSIKYMFVQIMQLFTKFVIL